MSVDKQDRRSFEVAAEERERREEAMKEKEEGPFSMDSE